jgi:FHA domain
MAPPDPKRPPSPEDSQGVELRSDELPGEEVPGAETSGAELKAGELPSSALPAAELPFEDGEVVPLQADDPRPQQVPQFPAGKRRRPARGARRDRELAARYEVAEAQGEPARSLYVERGPGAGQLLPVPTGTFILGRSSGAHLRLSHPSISRRHAELTRHGERFALRDLRSQNGTWVNRKRVRGEVEVFCGDELRLGNAVLRLRGANAPRRPARAPRAPALDPRPGARRRKLLLLGAATLLATLALLGLGARRPLLQPAVAPPVGSGARP